MVPLLLSRVVVVEYDMGSRWRWRDPVLHGRLVYIYIYMYNHSRFWRARGRDDETAVRKRQRWRLRTNRISFLLLLLLFSQLSITKQQYHNIWVYHKRYTRWLFRGIDYCSDGSSPSFEMMSCRKYKTKKGRSETTLIKNRHPRDNEEASIIQTQTKKETNKQASLQRNTIRVLHQHQHTSSHQNIIFFFFAWWIYEFWNSWLPSVRPFFRRRICGRENSIDKLPIEPPPAIQRYPNTWPIPMAKIRPLWKNYNACCCTLRRNVHVIYTRRRMPWWPNHTSTLRVWNVPVRHVKMKYPMLLSRRTTNPRRPWWLELSVRRKIHDLVYMLFCHSPSFILLTTLRPLYLLFCFCFFGLFCRHGIWTSSHLVRRGIVCLATRGRKCRHIFSSAGLFSRYCHDW